MMTRNYSGWLDAGLKRLIKQAEGEGVGKGSAVDEEHVVEVTLGGVKLRRPP